MWVGALLAVVGCAHKKTAAPSPATPIDLAGKHAEYRDWRGQDACAADPMTHWSQLEAWSGLLTEFLKATGKAADEVWTEDEVNTLEKAQAELPAALDGLDTQVSGVSKCPFPKTSGVEDSAKAADELAQQARKRLTDSQKVMARLKESLELNKWKAAQAEAMQTGREQWCGEKPTPDIFYAAEDETGKSEWHFCDGVTVVVASEGAKPELHVEEGKKKPHNPKPYVDAAHKYPPSEMQHPPKPGESTASQESAEKPES